MVKTSKRLLSIIFSALMVLSIVPFFAITSFAVKTYEIDKFEFKTLKANPEIGDCICNRIVITPFANSIENGKIEDGTYTFSLNDGNYISKLVIVASNSFNGSQTPSGEGVSVSGKTLTYSGVAKKYITIEHLSTDSVYSITVTGMAASHIHTDEDGNSEAYTEFDLDNCVTKSVIKEGKYYLTENTALSEYLYVNAGTSVTICLNGYVLDASVNQSGIINYGDLTITDCNDKKKKHYFNVTDDGKWEFYSDKVKTENVISGGVFTGATGGSVSLATNSVTQIENISFVGNYVAYGSVIGCGDVKSCTIENCYIAHNSSLQGVVYNMVQPVKKDEYAAVLYLTDTVIEDNTSGANNIEDGAGGVCNKYYSKCIISNCKIRNNTTKVSNGAGGIFSRGALTITDTEISGNSGVYGGGISLGETGTLIMTGGSITGNTARDYGGAINTDKASYIKLNSVNIADNVVTNYDGGGVYVYVKCDVTATDCTFTGNTAANGGAVCFRQNGTFTAENCTFTENKARNYGGALCCLSTATLSLKDTTITNNADSGYSGGILVGLNTKTKLNVYGATVIKDNTGVNGKTHNVYAGEWEIEVKEQSPDMSIGVTYDGQAGTSYDNLSNIGYTYLDKTNYNPLFYDNDDFVVLNETFKKDNYRTYTLIPSATASAFTSIGIASVASLVVIAAAVIGVVVYKKKKKTAENEPVSE